MTESQQDQYSHSQARKRFSLGKLLNENRAFILLAALAFQILFSGKDLGGDIIDTVVRLFTVLAAIYMAADNRKHFLIGLSLGIPSFLLITLSGPADSTFINWSTYFFTLGLYLYVMRLMLIRIFNAKVITINLIGLALCTYILIGAVWVLFYSVVVALDPHAFTLPILNDGDAFHTLGYFSYVTLTTLGYGDISPVSDIARNLAVLEALTGTMFLAVLISRLVGSYVSRKDQ
jgi:hypothetical protein